MPSADGEEAEIAFVAGTASKFSFSLDLPLTFAGNPEHSPAGSADAAHFTPTAKLSFGDKQGELSYGATVFAIGDDFFGGAAKDTSIFGASFNASLRDRTKKIAISAGYSPKRVFSGTFDASTVTLHDLSIGLGRTLPIGKASIAIDLSYIRREASKPGFQQHQPTLAVVLSGKFGDGFSWQLKQQVQRRLFSDPVSLDRRDWNFSTLAEISRPLNGAVTAKLDLIFERNSSNLDPKSYSAFDIGPKFSLVRPF